MHSAELDHDGLPGVSRVGPNGSDGTRRAGRRPDGVLEREGGVVSDHDAMQTRHAQLREAAWVSRAALAIALLSAAPVTLAEPPGVSEPGGRPDDLVTFTVSGGVSLGVYEAGLTWGVVRFLQAARAGQGSSPLFRPRLATVTGASAGAVNAVLAAALWCERPERRGDVDANLLLDSWLDLDVSGLLPRASQGYSAGDGLLAAAPLERAGRTLRTAVFGRGATGRFEPGCRVPIGITVTPFEPRRRDVAGLSAASQRLVLPWRLEVGAGGDVTVRRQPITDRELTDDVLDLAGIPGPGEATPFRPEVVVEALLASTAVPVAFAPRRLCARVPGEGGSAERCDLYVDGGVFDNAPLGLEADLAEDAGGWGVLHPITSYLVDPERLRLRPPASEAGASDGPATLERQLRLLENLLGTARSAELARAAKSRGWNRTTERVVRESAALAVEIAELYMALAPRAVPGQAEGGVRSGQQGQLADRAAFGRALTACLERLTADNDATQSACSREVPGLDVESAVPGEQPLSPAEVVRLAERLVDFLRVATERAMTEHGRPDLAGRERSRQVPAPMAAATFLFLADEVRRISVSGLPEPELRHFREAMLEPVRRSGAAFGVFDRVLRDRLDEQLAELGRMAPPSVAEAVRDARGRLAAWPPGAPFGDEVLEPVVAARADALARGTWGAGAVGEAWRGILELVEVRARSLDLSARLAALRADAAGLAGGDRPEHTLLLSSRFAPLAGSQLAGFGAFLDRPLRRYDYYAGVYESVHVVAVGVCTNRPSESNGEAPVRLHDDPSVLDLSAPATQRCLGRSMRRVVEVLGVPASPQASHVVATLARLELAASLGSSTRALLLLGEPSWSWLDSLGGPLPGDAVAATLDALIGTRVRCRPEDAEALCPAELPFDEFLAALRAHGYRPASDAMANAIRDPEAWSADMITRLADRALAVEGAATSPPGPLFGTIETALEAASLFSRRTAMRGPAPRFVLDPSTIPGPAEGPRGGEWPRVLAHVVPYRLSLDFAHGGFSAAWFEPELHLTRWLSVQSTLEEIGYRSGTGWTSAAGALVVGHAPGLSVGAGPRGWFDWGGTSGLGAEARVAVLQDRVAFGVGVRDARAGARDRGWFLTVSVADLNGLFYWLLSPRRSG